MAFSIKDIVKHNHVSFVRLRHGVAYYSVAVPGQSNRFVFPVPLDDIGDATLLATDKALLFMRYIRKAIEDSTFVSDAGA